MSVWFAEGIVSGESSTSQQFIDIYKSLVSRGVQFLREHHRDAATGGYKWTLNLKTGECDATNHNYGLAFVTLAYATAIRAGFSEYKTYLDETWDTMTNYFWEEEYGLYADEANADFSVIGDYRGQNSNMHSVEAHIAAYEATGEMRHLDRARIIATNMCIRQCERVKVATGEESSNN
jgi:mannose/cellobiose epimerase-like protein (N-acyl-D-glucosamine 2-epimerase family)